MAMSKRRTEWLHPAVTSVLPPIGEEEAVHPVRVALQGRQFLAGGKIDSVNDAAVGAGEDGLLVLCDGERGDGIVPALLLRNLHRAEFLAIRQVPDADLSLLPNRRQHSTRRVEAEERGYVGVVESPKQLPFLIVDRDGGCALCNGEESHAVRRAFRRVGLKSQGADLPAGVGFDEYGRLIANGDEVLRARGVPEAVCNPGAVGSADPEPSVRA